MPDPGYAPETTTVPARRTVPANAAANCPGKVMTFQPGFYDDAAALSDLMEGNGPCKDSVWWFQPGVYYFDFLNTGSHQWLLKNGHLLAGTPVDGGGTPLAAPVQPVSVPGGCDNPIHSPTAVGVQFIFGGDSQFQLAGDANAEICGTYHADRPPLAVYGVRTTGTVTPGRRNGSAGRHGHRDGIRPDAIDDHGPRCGDGTRGRPDPDLGRFPQHGNDDRVVLLARSLHPAGVDAHLGEGEDHLRRGIHRREQP